MSGMIRVGNVAVSTQVVAVYSHYLHDVIAALVAEDYGQGAAVDSQFKSILPEPYRLVVYRRFVGIYSSADDGSINDAFFVPREAMVPASILEEFLNSIPPSHGTFPERIEEGFLGRLRDRLFDALRHGGCERRPTAASRSISLAWYGAKADLEIYFDFSGRLIEVTRLTYRPAK